MIPAPPGITAIFTFADDKGGTVHREYVVAAFDRDGVPLLVADMMLMRADRLGSRYRMKTPLDI